MTWIRKNALFSIAAGAIALVAVVFYSATNTDVSQAQLSCDDPFGDTEVSFRTSGWTTDFCQYTIDLTEILWGGVPRDGIPPIDNPEFDSIDVADEWLQPQSPVVVIEINDDARAYPLAILTRHEIVNDIVGDVPVAVTFCPLCNSAMVFDRRLDDDVLRLGVSGNLRIVT